MGIPQILRPTKKKIVVLIVIFLGIFLAYNFFGVKKQTPLQFTKVKRQDIKSIVSSSGALTGKSSASLKFKSSGKLSFINVKAGDQVFAGQILAGLDSQDLSIALQQAQNTLRDKQATTNKVLDDIYLFQYGNGGFPNVGSPNETMTQIQLRTTAEVARDNAYDNVKAAQRDFQDTVISSPINGIVTQAFDVPGQIVTSADLIAQIVDTSAIYFDTDIDEADISKLTTGLAVEVTLDAYPDGVFKGSVEQIIPQTKTTSTGATVVTARIRLDNPKLTFINGLSGQASVIISEQKDTLAIPQESLRDDNTVLLQTPQGLRSQKVVTGIQSDTDVEIKEGLSADDRVVLNPPANGLPNRTRNPLQSFFRSFGGGRR